MWPSGKELGRLRALGAPVETDVGAIKSGALQTGEWRGSAAHWPHHTVAKTRLGTCVIRPGRPLNITSFFPNPTPVGPSLVYLAASLQLHCKDCLRYQPLMAIDQMAIRSVNQRHWQRGGVHGLAQQITLVHQNMVEMEGNHA